MMHMMRSSAGATTLAGLPFSLNSEMRSRPRSLRGSRPQMGPGRLRPPRAAFDLEAELQPRLFRNISVFMLTHNDWFHRAAGVITEGFPLLNGNYKRQIDCELLTS